MWVVQCQPVIGAPPHASWCCRVSGGLPSFRVEARRDVSMNRRKALLREAPAPVSAPLVRRETATDHIQDSVDGLNKQQVFLAKVGAASIGPVVRRRPAPKQTARRWADVPRMEHADPAADFLRYM